MLNRSGTTTTPPEGDRRRDQRLAPDFLEAARRYKEQGMAAHPLCLDPDGFAKKPSLQGWTRFKPLNNTEHDWTSARGLGLVLGPNSGNLAVLDIDDAGLAERIRRHLLAMKNPPLMARTAHDRLHVYAVETESTRSIDISVQHQNRWCPVQLLAARRQVAAWPTPGYEWVNPEAEPHYGNLPAFWHKLSLSIGLPYQRAQRLPRGVWSRK